MKKRSVVALVVFVVFYVAWGSFLAYNQERLVYQPSSQDFFNCPALAEAEAVNHQGTRMYVKWYKEQMAVLYHGNAGSACDRAFYTKILESAGYGYILVEYAGYSSDERDTTHELVKADVGNVVDYLGKRPPDKTLVIGESIGTGAAAYHTSLLAPDKLLLLAPFTNLADVAAHHFWFYPTQLFVKNAFDNSKLLENYPGDSLIIHGTRDEVIPERLGRELYERLGGNKIKQSIPEAGHNDLFGFPETYEAMWRFLSP